MALLNIFDTITRFTTSENLLIEFISNQNSRTMEYLPQLVSQFISVAEELASKVYFIQHGEYKSLAGKKFYFGGDVVSYDTIEKRVSQVKDVIERQGKRQQFEVPLQQTWRMRSLDTLIEDMMQRHSRSFNGQMLRAEESKSASQADDEVQMKLSLEANKLEMQQLPSELNTDKEEIEKQVE